MLKIKTCIFTIFILLNINIVYAVSFDCNKASRASEKAICSNVELSVLDDELNAIYKKILLTNPETKSSQREWIQATRICESNAATLNSCIKSAYINRIAILENKKIPAETTRVDPVLQEAGGKKNDLVAMNNVPVKTLQQQTPQSLPLLQSNKHELAITQNTSLPSSQQSIIKQGDVISKTSSVFNLKGFNLNMTRNDVKKLIPNSKPEVVGSIEGKEWSGYNCGVVAQQTPSGCNFTYAGEEITGITVSFWGDRAFEIQLYFGTHRPNEHNVAGIHLDRKMRQALDTKYPEESNTTGPNGNIGTRWESGSEYLKTEYVEDKNFKSNSISLLDIEYRKQFRSANTKHQEAVEKVDKIKNNKKLLSDM